MYPNFRRKENKLLDSKRFITLTDGVFAIAMTILVFNIRVPQGVKPNNHGLWHVLSELSPVLIDYAVSFFLLALLWLQNHRHHSWLKGTKRGHLWLGMLYLMFVGLIPFTTSLMAQFNDQALADVLFHLNLLAVGLCTLGQWYYATRKDLVISDNGEEFPFYRLGMVHLVLPATACLAILFSFLAPGSSNLVYFIMPLVVSHIHRTMGANNATKAVST